MTEPGAGAPGSLARIRRLSEGGVSRAADSLARLLGFPVRFSSPEIQRFRASALPDPGAIAAGSLAALRVAICGQGSGWILILLPLPTVYHFLQSLTGTPAEPRDLTATERSAMQEVGNIVASSFLSELGDRVGRRLLPSAPEWYLDGVADAVRGVLASVRDLGSDAIVVQAALEDGDGRVQGRMFVVSDVGAWTPIGRDGALR